MILLKKYIILIFTILIISNNISYANANKSLIESKNNEKEWTWIFYDDADSFNMGDPMNMPDEYIMYV